MGAGAGGGTGGLLRLKKSEDLGIKAPTENGMKIAHWNQLGYYNLYPEEARCSKIRPN